MKTILCIFSGKLLFLCAESETVKSNRHKKDGAFQQLELLANFFNSTVDSPHSWCSCKTFQLTSYSRIHVPKSWHFFLETFFSSVYFLKFSDFHHYLITTIFSKLKWSCWDDGACWVSLIYPSSSSLPAVGGLVYFLTNKLHTKFCIIIGIRLESVTEKMS